MKSKFVFAALIAGLFSSYLTAEELNYSTGVNVKTKASLSLSSPMQELPTWGFYPVIATVRNDGSTAQSWQIETVGSATRNSWSSNTSSKNKSSFTVSCAPGQTKTYELVVPVSRPLDNDSFFSSGTRHKDLRSSLSFTIKNGKNKTETSVDTSVTTGKPHSLVSQQVIQNLSRRHYTSALSDNSGLFTPALLNNNIDTLRGYDGLILTLTEWQALDKSVRQTLIDWTKQGGRLTICHTSKDLTLQNLGFTSEALRVGNIASGISSYKVQNGRVNLHIASKGFSQRSLSELVSKNGYSTLQRLNNDFSTKHDWPLHEAFAEKDFGIALIIIILVIFAIFVGPINFFIFAKQGKRHRLFYTTSIISIITSLILLVTILLKDGIGGEGVQLVHKEIDSSNKKAFIQQEQFCRTGMLLNTAFETKDKFALAQVPIQPSRWARVSNKDDSPSVSYNILQQEEGMLCSGDYFKSRSEHAHFIKAEQVTQEGFSVNKTNNGYSVVSTFADNIDEFYFNDGEKNWVAKNLSTGAEVTATEATDSDYSDWIATQKSLCSNRLKKQISTLAARKNSFVAVTNKAAGIQTHSSIDWQTTTLLTGVISLN